MSLWMEDAHSTEGAHSDTQGFGLFPTAVLRTLAIGPSHGLP